MSTETNHPKHTPGPWALGPIGWQFQNVTGPDGFILANVTHGNEHDAAAREANARLIAAAPALLAAAQAAHLELRQLHAHHYAECKGACPAHAAMLELREAIRCAGEEPRDPWPMPEPVATAHALRDCLGAMQAMREQIEQMRGMFPDEDGTIADACEAHDEAARNARHALELTAAPATPRPDLAEALREVLPYAENEAAALSEAARRDDDAMTAEEAEKAWRAIERAQSLIEGTQATGGGA